MNPAAKYAFALECLIDLDEAQEILKDRFYGDTDRLDIPWNQFSRTAFSQIPPRKGVLGFIQDMVSGGAQFVFFTSTQDRVLGERAEHWLREWLANPQINIAQTATPANLDAQVFFVPAPGEGLEPLYRFPAGRPRIVELPTGGVFYPEDYHWAIDLEESGFAETSAPATEEPGDELTEGDAPGEDGEADEGEAE